MEGRGNVTIPLTGVQACAQTAVSAASPPPSSAVPVHDFEKGTSPAWSSAEPENGDREAMIKC